ncbi:MAG: LysR family transcriptional regulator [Eggerthellaceae bacterium]|nr:LysR family transcriptional regulator [Eggerthellaceae bacterium]
MQTNCLRHFVEVAEKGSISAAAASAFMTPQGLSRSLSSLETELGCSLFSKHQGRMLLTVFGEALLPEAKAILRHEQAMVDLVPSIRSAEEGRVSSGASLYLNNAAFDAALFDPITQSFDGVFSQARYFQCDNKGVVDALLGADDDAVVLGMLVLFSTHAEENEEMLGRLVSEGFTYQSYLESYDEVMVSSRSHLAGKTALTRSDILSEPIISSDGDIRAVCERLFGEGAISMVTSDSSFRFKMVASGKGITFVPAFRRIAAETKEGLVTVPMKNPYYLEVVFAGRAAVLADPVVRRVFAQLNVYYSQFADSPYLSLVPGPITQQNMLADLPPAMEERLAVIIREAGLTSREGEILPDLARGMTVRDLADKLCVSPFTVKSHAHGIYKKLHVHSQKEVMAFVSCHGR